MKSRSLVSTLFSFLFTVIGFWSHWLTIENGDKSIIAIVAFIYICPLWIEAVEDLDNIAAGDHVQYVIDQISVVIGALYLLGTLGLLVWQSKGMNVELHYVFQHTFVLLPAIFLVRKGYSLRIKWLQNRNAERVYHASTLAKLK